MVSGSMLAGLLVALAMGASSIVFSEPAAADALMLGVIVGVPILGAGRFGKVAILNALLWLAIVGLGIAAVAFSAQADTAIKHQLVTLYLAGGAFVLAGYISASPERRFALVMACYIAASLIATLAGLAGYFRLFPAAFDLFTSFGRARGTFKDPNVYGAAIAPAILACAWVMLREQQRFALWAAAIALPLVLGLLLSFSRGAWISLALSLTLLGGGILWSSRRCTDFQRIRRAGATGIVVIACTLVAALQSEQVSALLTERASLDQSYDQGPDGRFGGQAKASRLIVENPLGIGTHTFRDVHHREEPHNVFLSMFLNAGWLGGLLYIIAVGGTLYIGCLGSLRMGVLQGPFLIATTAFAGVAFEGFVIDSDHWRSFFIVMGCIWGLADAPAPDIDRTQRHDD